MHAPFLALFAGSELSRRAIRTRLGMYIAKSALATLCDQRPFLVCREVRDVWTQFTIVGVGNHGPDRHAQDDVVGAFAVLIRAAAILAMLGAVQPRISVIDQRIDVAIGHRIDAPAMPAVAPLRSAARNIFI